MAETLEAALAAGYRHFDTAASYGEEELGKALESWLSSGKVKREELFIVTKLPPSGNRQESVEKWMKLSLKRLRLDYVDLYLIHKPFGFQERGDEFRPRDEDGSVLLDHTTDHISLWKGMEAQVDAGRARAIGLSDFNERQIKRILDNCRIKPANVQTELHVIYQRKPLVELCHKHGITVCAYAPLGAPGKQDFFKGVFIPKLLVHPVVKEVTAKYRKTSAQILLRHTVLRGIAAIPKSTNPHRIRENIGIFDFTLLEEDRKKLDALDKGKNGKVLVPKNWMKGVDAHPEYNYANLTGQREEDFKYQ